MTVVVRELIIRATVEQTVAGASAQPSETAGAGPDARARQDIVAECVAQVLEILRESEER